MSNAALINAAGTALQAIRALDDGDLIVSIGAHGPSYDCRDGHVSVTLRRGGDTVTSEAVGLYTALHLARGKLNAVVAAREQAKDKSPSPPSGPALRPGVTAPEPSMAGDGATKDHAR